MSGLLELAERCEKAPGPDRALSDAIYDWCAYEGDPEYPHYTSSLDAAAATPALALCAAALRARAASVDTLPKGQDTAGGLVRSKGSAVAEGETP